MLDISRQVREHGKIRDIGAVNRVLAGKKTLSESAQIGGTNLRVAVASVDEDLRRPPVLTDISVDTFVIDNKGYDSSAIRNDLVLLQDITSLVVNKAHSLVRNLKMIFGLSGAPTTNTQFMARCGASDSASLNQAGTFFLPNVQVSEVIGEDESAHLLNMPNFIHAAVGDDFASSFKHEDSHVVELAQWSPEKQQLADDQASTTVKIVNDAVAHVRQQAASYDEGANLMHLVMSTGTNVGIGYKKQKDELGNFEKTINTEAGHIPFVDLLPKEAKSPLVLRWKKLDNPSFETIMAGGNSASPERGLAGLVRDLRAHKDDSDFIQTFVDKVGGDHYSQALNLAIGETAFVDNDFRESSLITDELDDASLNQAIEKAAEKGDKLAKVLIAIWSKDLADVLNGLAAKIKEEQGMDAGTKFNLSVNGSIAYGILDNPKLDFASTILINSLNDEDHFVIDPWKPEGFASNIAISRPLAEMDGLVEQAYRFAAAAIQAA